MNCLQYNKNHWRIHYEKNTHVFSVTCPVFVLQVAHEQPGKRGNQSGSICTHCDGPTGLKSSTGSGRLLAESRLAAVSNAKWSKMENTLEQNHRSAGLGLTGRNEKGLYGKRRTVRPGFSGRLSNLVWFCQPESVEVYPDPNQPWCQPRNV